MHAGPLFPRVYTYKVLVTVFVVAVILVGLACDCAAACSNCAADQCTLTAAYQCANTCTCCAANQRALTGANAAAAMVPVATVIAIVAIRAAILFRCSGVGDCQRSNCAKRHCTTQNQT